MVLDKCRKSKPFLNDVNNSVFSVKHTVTGFLHCLETGPRRLEHFCSISTEVVLLFDLGAKSY